MSHHTKVTRDDNQSQRTYGAEAVEQIERGRKEEDSQRNKWTRRRQVLKMMVKRQEARDSEEILLQKRLEAPSRALANHAGSASPSGGGAAAAISRRSP